MMITYNQAAQSLQSTVEDKLNTMTELKKNSLDQWVDEQQRNAVFLANLPEMRSLSGGFLNSKWSIEERIMARHELTDLLRIVAQRTSDVQDIQILDLNGRIVISTLPPLVGTVQGDQAFFQEGVDKTFTQTFYRSRLFGRTILSVATPLYNAHQEKIGVLALHFNMQRVSSIIHEDPRFISASVQTYLIGPSHDEITETPNLSEQMGALHSPAIDFALRGGQGSSSYVNHKGDHVIGKYVWLSGENVALIVELDQDIALQPARQLAARIGLVGILFAVFLIAAVIIMARRITAPLRALSETVSDVSAGELNAMAPVLSEDEVGTLARAFNAMTEKLRQTMADMQNELWERRLTEIALRESEERFRKVFHSSPVRSVSPRWRKDVCSTRMMPTGG